MSRVLILCMLTHLLNLPVSEENSEGAAEGEEVRDVKLEPGPGHEVL